MGNILLLHMVLVFFPRSIEVLNVTSTGTEISHIQSECTKSGLKVTLLMLRVVMTLGTD